MKRTSLLAAVIALLLPLGAFADGDQYHYTNPVIRKSLPDPTVVRAADGNFYLSATEDTRNVPIYRSPNLVDWEFLGTAFTKETHPSFLRDGMIWAPDNNYAGGRYVMYYTMSKRGGEWVNGVGVATADSPEGPYTDHGNIFLTADLDIRNSIDQFYFEDNGSKYMIFGSFFGIYIVELSDDGLGVRDGSVPQRIAGSALEGSCLYKKDGYYYLIASAGYSGNSCHGDCATYHLVVARSEDLYGPYVDKDGLAAINDHYAELLHKNDAVRGPGHCSEVIEDDAGQTWLMHPGFATADKMAGRIDYLTQVLWDSEGWPYVVNDTPPASWDRPAFPGHEFTYSDADYIEYTGGADGSCIYDTGYVPKENTRIEVKCRSYSADGAGGRSSEKWRTVVSAGQKTDGYSLYVRGGGTDWAYYSGGYIKQDGIRHEYDVDYTISLSRSALTVNGRNYPANTTAYAGTSERLKLFSGFQGAPYCGRIYYVKVYEGDTLVRDYSPCVRNEDGMPMFRDSVTGTCIRPYDPAGIGAVSEVKAKAESYAVDLDRYTHTCGGWGVSLCWWASQVGQHNPEQLDELIDLLVSPEHLNYSVFRYNIGGGDDPEWRNCDPHHFANPKDGKGLLAEMEGFKDGPDQPYVWDRDAGQIRVLLKIRDMRPDATFEAFSNSCPWWMTVSGCVGGATPGSADNLRTDMYGTFAHYLVDVCRHFKDEYGIEFHSLEPFNEPVTSWWYQNGSQEGCHFDYSSQIEFVRTLHPILQESGLKTVISASDESYVEDSVKGLREFAKAGAVPLLGQWNTHTYKGSDESKVELRELCDSLGIGFWQSETGLFGTGMKGNIDMGQRIVDDTRYLQSPIWCDWQYVKTNNRQWCMLLGDENWQNCVKVTNYYIRYQFSHFITPGYRWIMTDDKHGVAAVSPEGDRLVYVTVNPSESETRDVSLQVPEGASLQELYRTSESENCERISPSGDGSFRLAPLSVVTAVYSL